MPRGIFYCARILSQEYNVEFNAKDYSRIKKVYSIWICKDVPDKYANTITSYSIKENDMYGEFTGETYYDLVNVVMIRLGSEDIASDNELIGLLKANKPIVEIMEFTELSEEEIRKLKEEI